MRMRTLIAIAAAWVFNSASSSLAGQQNQGSSVALAPSYQSSAVMVSDGGGGAYVTWQDSRRGSYDIYAQHLLPMGGIDPAWPINGIAICAARSDQYAPSIIGDESGGAIVAWLDFRNGSDWNVFAQHLLPMGRVDPAWPTDGRVLCGAAGIQTSVALVVDGAGGAIATWVDDRPGAPGIYGQHLNASGQVDAAWPVNGLRVTTPTTPGSTPFACVGDGAGGVLIAFQIITGSETWDLYAQHVLGPGALDPAWAGNIPVAVAPSEQIAAAAAGDGTGGMLLAWVDYRNGGRSEIYAQHLLGNGTIAPGWQVNGLALTSTAPDFSKLPPRIVPDGTGGALVAWSDRVPGSNYGVWAQHLRAEDGPDPAWPAGGRQASSDFSPHYSASLDSDGHGGALLAWNDYRWPTSPDIFVQHLLADGSRDPVWPQDGQAVCAAPGFQGVPEVVSDGASGLFIAWSDARHPIRLAGLDVYAQHLNAAGMPLMPDTDAPHLNAIRDVPGDQGGRVYLTWSCVLDFPGIEEVTGFRVWRRVPAPAASLLVAEGPPGGAQGVGSGTRYLTRTDANAQPSYWEAIATLPTEQLVNYGYTAATPSDSSGAGSAYTAYFVTALTANPSVFYESAVDSGYSIDNLAPPAPAPLVASYAAGVTTLHWSASRAPDLLEFRLYRGTSPSFAPSWSNLLAATRDTMFRDPTQLGYTYKLVAVDVHGNPSRVLAVTPERPVATLASVTNAEGFPDHVSLAWYLAGGSATSATLYRRSQEADWQTVTNLTPDGEGFVRYIDMAVESGRWYGYRLGIYDAGVEVFAGEAWVSTLAPAFLLEGASPNPARAERLVIAYSLPGDKPARLDLLDVSGRRVLSRDLRGTAAGRHAADLSGHSELRPGVYLLRLSYGSWSQTRRIVLLD